MPLFLMKALIIDESAVLTLRDVPVPITMANAAFACAWRASAARICSFSKATPASAGFRVTSSLASSSRPALPRIAKWVGRRVAGEINIGCGRCDFCAAGVREHCSDRTVLGIRERGGAFAEYHVAALLQPARDSRQRAGPGGRVRRAGRGAAAAFSSRWRSLTRRESPSSGMAVWACS